MILNKARSRVAINGFGRIGRLVLRALLESGRTDLEVVAINDLASIDISTHLLEFDSLHGRLIPAPFLEDSSLHVGPMKIHMLSERDPENLPWKALGIDIVLECSGVFTTGPLASKHLKAGAKKVLISAPATDVDKTIVFGVNHKTLTPEDRLVSNASCTTNCLAPVAAALLDPVGIERGFMTTIHSYTGDQHLVDTWHKDPHRARAAALSMIPTSTGAAKAVGLVLPSLKGKIDGTAIRVPTPNVSLIDFTFQSSRATTIKEINEALSAAAEMPSLKGILEINHRPLVSVDFNHCAASSIFDTTQTQVVDNTFCRVLAWYDNEWGFANRMGDTAAYMGLL